MTTEKPIGDMTLKELQEAEPIMFPKAVDKLTDEELSVKVEDVFNYLHHMPSDLSFDDEKLLHEMKRRFDIFIRQTPVETLRAKLSSIISYPGNLSDGDVKTLEEVLTHITPSDQK